METEAARQKREQEEKSIVKDRWVWRRARTCTRVPVPRAHVYTHAHIHMHTHTRTHTCSKSLEAKQQRKERGYGGRKPRNPRMAADYLDKKQVRGWGRRLLLLVAVVMMAVMVMVAMYRQILRDDHHHRHHHHCRQAYVCMLCVCMRGLVLALRARCPAHVMVMLMEYAQT